MVRTRIAPSPTGDLHIGHLRTLLYNYALAKQSNGAFLVRIEDTDQTRFVEGAMERTLDVISDYGLSWDEGPRVGGAYAPYIQSQRLDVYKEFAAKLVSEGNAYYCFCTPERLTELRESQQKNKLPPKYDRKCLHMSEQETGKHLEAGKPHVIRLKVPENSVIDFEDEVYGHLEFASDEVDDQVLLKSDGFPTYHLAVVVDDHLMNITHIIRGNDWLPSTPKHVLLYKAFGWKMPKFVHLPNLKEAGQNKKLSKRYGAVAATQFLQQGYLPEAVLNFLMFLGWNPGTDKEIYTVEEFTKDFSISKLHKTDLVVFDRQKLLWFNGLYIRNLSPQEFRNRYESWARRYQESTTIETDKHADFTKVLSLVQDRVKTLEEVESLVKYFFVAPELESAMLVSYCMDSARSRVFVEKAISVLSNVSEQDWISPHLDEISHSMVAEMGYKNKEAFMTLRYSLTGQAATPPLFDVIEVLGKEEVLKRLEKALLLL